jgi:hypothetical protein
MNRKITPMSQSIRHYQKTTPLLPANYGDKLGFRRVEVGVALVEGRWTDEKVWLTSS